jgi:two-component system phosphate regulon sensor histidine kinase PhoR
MGWWLARTLAALLAVFLGGLAGALFGGGLGSWSVGAAGGGLLAFFVLVLRDSWRGQGLMNWLRGPLTGSAPRDSGFWGELAYRVERAVRAREQNIQQERDRLAQFLSAIEASPNGVMLLDGADQIEWCNSVAAEHFGLDPERDRRQRVTNLVRMPVFVSHLQAGRFGEPVEFSGPLGRSTLSVLVRPYGDGMKLVLSQDITERERAEAMRRDFVANVSHEIRTPLTVLSGFIETLAQLPLTEVERQRVMHLMSQQTERMQALVGDLLTLARLEGSPRPAPDRWCAMEPLLRQALQDAELLSAGRHTLSIESAEDAEVAGSDTELLSAITNLLNNAVRYTPAGGQHQPALDRGASMAVRSSRCSDSGHRHRPRAPGPPDRTLLPRRRQPLARNRRYGSGPVHRQARGAAPPGAAADGQHARQGFDLQHPVPGFARAPGRVGGGPASTGRCAGANRYGLIRA